jgi:hypothetical protein
MFFFLAPVAAPQDRLLFNHGAWLQHEAMANLLEEIGKRPCYRALA